MSMTGRQKTMSITNTSKVTPSGPHPAPAPVDWALCYRAQQGLESVRDVGFLLSCHVHRRRPTRAS
jgi:hypothetical protein